MSLEYSTTTKNETTIIMTITRKKWSWWSSSSLLLMRILFQFHTSTYVLHYSTEKFVVWFCDHSHWWFKLWSFEKNDYIIIIWFLSLWSKQTWRSLFSRDTMDYGIDSSIFLDQKKSGKNISTRNVHSAINQQFYDPRKFLGDFIFAKKVGQVSLYLSLYSSHID